MSQTIESIKTYPAATMEQIKGAMDEAVSIVRQDLPVFTDKFPDSKPRLTIGGYTGFSRIPTPKTASIRLQKM